METEIIENEWAKLPVLSREEAQEKGYVAISSPFNPEAEPEVVKSMEGNMRGCDAVWIVSRYFRRTECELARKKGDVNTLVEELS